MIQTDLKLQADWNHQPNKIRFVDHYACGYLLFSRSNHWGIWGLQTISQKKPRTFRWMNHTSAWSSSAQPWGYCHPSKESINNAAHTAIRWKGWSWLAFPYCKEGNHRSVAFAKLLEMVSHAYSIQEAAESQMPVDILVEQQELYHINEAADVWQAPRMCNILLLAILCYTDLSFLLSHPGCTGPINSQTSGCGGPWGQMPLGRIGTLFFLGCGNESIVGLLMVILASRFIVNSCDGSITFCRELLQTAISLYLWSIQPNTSPITRHVGIILWFGWKKYPGRSGWRWRVSGPAKAGAPWELLELLELEHWCNSHIGPQNVEIPMCEDQILRWW